MRNHLKDNAKINELVATHVLEQIPGSVPIPQFTQDIAAAWRLVDRICDRGAFRFQIDGNKLWQARFYKSAAHTLETRAFAATSGEPALAICLAALAVKGIDPSQLSPAESI